MIRPIALALAFAAAAGLTAAGPAPARAQSQSQPGPGLDAPASDSLGAGWGPQQDQARAAVREGRYVPLLKVIKEIRSRDPGRQLDAGIETMAGRPVYRVRWASADGRRIDYIVDAQSGAILSAQ